jgi:hypothetical protein
MALLSRLRTERTARTAERRCARFVIALGPVLLMGCSSRAVRAPVSTSRPDVQTLTTPLPTAQTAVTVDQSARSTTLPSMPATVFASVDNPNEFRRRTDGTFELWFEEPSRVLNYQCPAEPVLTVDITAAGLVFRVRGTKLVGSANVTTTVVTCISSGRACLLFVPTDETRGMPLLNHEGFPLAETSDEQPPREPSIPCLNE